MAQPSDEGPHEDARAELGASGAPLGESAPPESSTVPRASSPTVSGSPVAARSRTWRAEWPLWACNGAVLSLLLIDLLLPMAGALSMGVLALLTFVFAPWSWYVLAKWRAARAPGHWLRLWAYALPLAGLATVVLGAKWWLLLGTLAAEPGHYAGSSRSYSFVLLGILAMGVLGSGRHIARLAALVVDHPARLMAFSFALTGVAGAFALSLPISLQRVYELSVLDNLFMAFSAVCVTGLAVRDVATTYTWTGQLVICLLAQIGGLGIMVLSAAVAVLTGQRMRVKRSAVLAEIVDADSLAQLRKLVVAIVVSTLLIEAAAAGLLYLEFTSDREQFARAAGRSVVYGPIWAAVFHAVCAFCNAGFSNFEAGLMPYVGDPAVIGLLIALIVTGGIGFPVLYELGRRFIATVRRRRREHMSLHARIALGASGFLLAVVAVAYLGLEWSGALSGLGWSERVLAAAFQSASARTAGYNVIDIGALGPATLMLTCIAMFIGASSGSCGGGVKVTTVAALFAGLRSELESRPAYLFDRALPAATIRKAIGVSFLSIGIVSVALFVLLLLEEHPPLELAFEVFSAFSTTGLSTGVTPRLSAAGKVLILLTMYVGRIGPLTLALALARRNEAARVQLPTERVLIG